MLDNYDCGCYPADTYDNIQEERYERESRYGSDLIIAEG